MWQTIDNDFVFIQITQKDVSRDNHTSITLFKPYHFVSYCNIDSKW